MPWNAPGLWDARPLIRSKVAVAVAVSANFGTPAKLVSSNKRTLCRHRTTTAQFCPIFNTDEIPPARTSLVVAFANKVKSVRLGARDQSLGQRDFLVFKPVRKSRRDSLSYRGRYREEERDIKGVRWFLFVPNVGCIHPFFFLFYEQPAT